MTSWSSNIFGYVKKKEKVDEKDEEKHSSADEKDEEEHSSADEEDESEKDTAPKKETCKDFPSVEPDYDSDEDGGLLEEDEKGLYLEEKSERVWLKLAITKDIAKHYKYLRYLRVPNIFEMLGRFEPEDLEFLNTNEACWKLAFILTHPEAIKKFQTCNTLIPQQVFLNLTSETVTQGNSSEKGYC